MNTLLSEYSDDLRNSHISSSQFTRNLSITRINELGLHFSTFNIFISEEWSINLLQPQNIAMLWHKKFVYKAIDIEREFKVVAIAININHF